MSLEVVNTLGTLLTVGIVAATAIAAMVQLRHLRASNQINAMLSIGSQIDAKEFQDAMKLVQRKLDATLEDPAYREFVRAIFCRTPVPAVPEEYGELSDAVRLVGNTYEELAILVKNGIVDRDIFLDRYSWLIIQYWQRLVRALSWARAVTNEPRLWENFEYLTVLAEDFGRAHGSTYPKGVRHLDVSCPWPVAPMPQTT